MNNDFAWLSGFLLKHALKRKKHIFIKRLERVGIIRALRIAKSLGITLDIVNDGKSVVLSGDLCCLILSLVPIRISTGKGYSSDGRKALRKDPSWLYSVLQGAYASKRGEILTVSFPCRPVTEDFLFAILRRCRIPHTLTSDHAQLEQPLESQPTEGLLVYDRLGIVNI